MTLNLQMLATLDAKGVEQGATEARREIGRLGTAVDQASAANDRAAASATNAANAHQAAAQAARNQANAARSGGQSAAQATQLAAHEVTNLSYQMNDIAVGLASGQSPFTVMAQQGLQVSQIMGRRGLGQIIPAIGTGLLSLINPTTLFLAGITAVGYGASAVFAAMRDDIEDVDEAIERHTDLISRIEEAYDQAGRGAKRYGRNSKAVLEADLRDDVATLSELLQQQRDQLFSYPFFFKENHPLHPYRLRPNYGEVSAPYQEALEDIAAFRDAAKVTAADVTHLYERLAELSNQGMSDLERETIRAVRSLLDVKNGALDSAEALTKVLGKSPEDIGLEQQREALNKFLTGQSDRTQRLNREAFGYRLGIATGADRKQLEERLVRSKAELEARQEIARREFELDSEEADRIRESHRARAEATIILNRQKTAYERLQEAREALTGQNDHIARLELETTLTGASNAQRAKAIALLQAEQDIRERKIDPGSGEAEQLRQAAARRAATEARLEEARVARDLSRSHEEDMQRLRLEALLIGRSNDVRDRAIALLEAEQEIRRRGIDVNGRLAETIRDNARALAQERSELERQKRAWGEVERAGTSAIDRITDGIAEGDIGGALESVAKDLTKTVLRLSTANPLKNALYGTNLPTLADTGGIGGFFSALLGGGPEAMRAGTMNVQAATVMLNGSVFASPFGAGGAFPPAPGLPGVASLLGGGSQATVAAQAWDFFSGKGLKDFQVAAILGHIKAESGFNPLAVGDGGHSLGLFQHHRGRASGLLDFLGGRGNLGNVGGQLNYAWKELMTSEGRAFRNLLSSTNLRDATAAFGGFERPAGFSFSDPQAMHNWTGRLQFAEQALRNFGNRTSGVTGNLGRLGDGLGSAVTSLSQGSNSLAGTASDFAGQSKGLLGQLTGGLRNLFSRLENAGGGSFGAGGNWLASLFGGSQLGIALSGGVGLYDSGGFTGTGDPAQPAGIVHAQEFVFDAPAVRRLGVPFLEALRSGETPGYRDGGVVSATPLPFPAGGAAGNGFANPANGIGEITIRLVDADGNEVETRRSRTPDGLQLEVLIDQTNGRLITRRGSRTRNALEAFDARNKVGSR